MTVSVRTNQMLAASNPSTKNFYTDDPKLMTFGRRFARLFSNSGCYNPSSKLERDEEKKDRAPNLDKGWEYFEHHILPRCLIPIPKDSKDTGYDAATKTGGIFTRADVGEHEKDTMLYPLWGTPLKDMGDFGVGVGLYFSTLQFLAIVSFLAGCLNVPIMLYFDSEEYNGEGVTKDMLRKLGLRGSAICLNTAWELCPECSMDDWTAFPSTDDRLKYGEMNVNGVDVKMPFIKKNGCNVTDNYAIISLVTMAFIVVSIYYWIFSLKKRIALYDDAELSSVDYTIEIKVSRVEFIQTSNCCDAEVFISFIIGFINNKTFCLIRRIHRSKKAVTTLKFGSSGLFLLSMSK